jgi:hypothetical protein
MVCHHDKASTHTHESMAAEPDGVGFAVHVLCVCVQFALVSPAPAKCQRRSDQLQLAAPPSSLPREAVHAARGVARH